MNHLYRQKEALLNQLTICATTLGFTHPTTVSKSQELDVIINKIMAVDLQKQKVS